MTLRELLNVIDSHIHVAVFDQYGGLWPTSDTTAERDREKYGWYDMTVTSIKPGAFDDLCIYVRDPELEV